MTEVNDREIALNVVMEVMERGAFTHIVLRRALEQYGYLPRQERAFISRLSSGTIERIIELDYMINQFSKVPVEKMKPVIRTILRLTAYQLKYMTAVPASAACNEAVRLANRHGFSSLKGFVNGVSRSLARNIHQFDTYECPELTYSMSGWILQEWRKTYSEEKICDILEHLYVRYEQEHEVCVRCNVSRQPQERVEDSLRGQDVHVRRETDWAQILYLSHLNRLDELEAFQKGWIQPQSVGSALIGRVAAPKSGDFCMDVCAAPGGKSIHLADQMGDVGVVDSRDLSYEKLSLIEENAVRCSFSCIRISQADARILDETCVEKADVVIADLPCSGLGIIGNKADIKYKMTLQKAHELAALQREILDVVWQYVKPGGILLYSTCTIRTEENEDNVAWFLAHHPFEREDFTEWVPDSLRQSSLQQGMLQILPSQNVEEGFFLAKMRRIDRTKTGTDMLP